ncbi:MAG: TerB family tellurite resistance protein [Flavobacteriaceae bacterium]|nr:TerB family tellurite resistance protein [Flavobacteriaceae bacterium]
MSFKNLFKSGEHSRNLGHFASLVTLASVQGEIKETEARLLRRFAIKLDISDEEVKKVLKTPSKFPINPPNNADERLERMHDIFKIIFADHEINEDEYQLLEMYAIGLGYTEELAAKLIKRSIQIYMGGLNFEDYRYLLNRK